MFTTHEPKWWRQQLVVTVVMGVIVAGCGSSSDDDVTGIAVPAATEAPIAPEDGAIAVVMSAIDAKNSFDLNGWLMAYEGGSRMEVPLFAEQILMNANQHWAVAEPCRVTGETASGDTVVECLITNTDDFWGVGEIYEPRDQQFAVNSEGLLTTDTAVMEMVSFASAKRDAFNRGFHQWLSESHPDVYADMDPGYISSNGPGFDTQNAEDMLIAVDYVEEFVAQSEIYPTEPANP